MNILAFLLGWMFTGSFFWGIVIGIVWAKYFDD